MKQDLLKSSSSKQPHWLDAAEILAAITAMGGSMASLVFQQAQLVVIPLSLSVGLGMINRARMKTLLSQRLQFSIAEASKANILNCQQYQADIEQLIQSHGQRQAALNQKYQTAITKLIQTNGKLQKHLNSKFQKSDEQMLKLESAQNQTADAIKELNLTNCIQTIESCDRVLRINAKDAEAYYSRGAARHELGDVPAAIKDYTQAIRLNVKSAKAYKNRGLAYIETNSQRDGVGDLQKASKLFFEQGEMGDYQEVQKNIKNVLKTLEVYSEADSSDNSQPGMNVTETVTVNNLFHAPKTMG